eukprot:g2865.t1
MMMMKLNNRALAFAAAVVLLCCTVAHGRIGAWKNPAGPVPAHCPTWNIRYTIGAMCDRWHRVFKVPNLKHPECGGKPSRCLFYPPKNACPRIPYKRCGEGMVKKYKLNMKNPGCDLVPVCRRNEDAPEFDEDGMDELGFGGVRDEPELDEDGMDELGAGRQLRYSERINCEARCQKGYMDCLKNIYLARSVVFSEGAKRCESQHNSCERRWGCNSDY